MLLWGLHRIGLFDNQATWAGISDIVLPLKLLALVFFVLTLLMVYMITRSVFGPGWRSWASLGTAGLLLAVSPNYVIWSVSGLENSLYGFLVAALSASLVVALARDALLHPITFVASALVVVLLAATRPDGLIFLAAYPGVAIATHWRQPRRLLLALVGYGLAAGIPLGLLLSWRHSAFGLWVPNTAIAKNQPELSLSVIGRADELVAAAGIGAVCIAVVCFTLVVIVPRLVADFVAPLPPRRLVGVVIPFVLAVAGYCILKPDWMGEYRFATPAAVLGSILLAILLVAALGMLGGLGHGPAVGAAVVGLLAGLTLVQAVPRIQQFRSEPTVPGCFVADRFGRMFNSYADELGVTSGTLLLPDIGGTLLTTRFRVVDLAGLTDPKIARYRQQRDYDGLVRYVVDDVRPTFVHAHSPWDPGLRDDEQFTEEYARISPGDYLRKDATTPARIKELRVTAAGLRERVDALDENNPRRGCGTLEVGQPVG